MSMIVIVVLVIALIAVSVDNARKVERVAAAETDRDEAVRQLSLNRQAHQYETVRAQQLFESLTDAKDRIVELTQDRTVITANLNKTGAEYNWLIRQLDGAHIRIKGKTKNIAQILERMPVDEAWAGLVEDKGPFTRFEGSAEKKPESPRRAQSETSGDVPHPVYGNAGVEADSETRRQAISSFHNPSGSDDWARSSWSSDSSSSSSSDSSSSSSSSSSYD